MIVPGTILDIGGVRYECVGLDAAGNAQCVPLTGSGLYTGTFEREPVPAFQPAVMPADWQPETPPADAQLQRIRENALVRVDALIEFQYGGDPNQARIQREYARTISQAELEQRLAKWRRFLAEMLRTERPTDFAAMQNDNAALESLEALIDIDCLIFVARGFLPPDEGPIVNELIESQRLRRALMKAIESEAYRRGVNVGIAAQRAAWLHDYTEAVKSMVRGFVAGLGEGVAQSAGGVGFGLLLLLAGLAAFGRR